MDKYVNRRELLRRGILGLGGLAIACGLGALLPAAEGLGGRGSRGNSAVGGRPFIVASTRGCDPTGTRVCTAELNETLAAAAGGTAWLGRGTYLFDQHLRLPSRTTLAGSGTLKLVEEAAGDEHTGALVLEGGCVVRDVTLDGNKAGRQSERPLILAVQQTDIEIVDAKIQNATGRSIFMFECARVRVHGCHIEHGGLTPAIDSTRAAILTWGSSHVTLTNNTITFSAGEGVALSANDALVANNRIQDTHGIGIAVGTGQRRVVIENNRITITAAWQNPSDGLLWPNCIDVGDSTDCQVVGNRTLGGSSGVANAPPSFRTTVMSNEFRGAGMWGVAIGGWVGRGSTDAVILDNHCIANGQAGIVLPYVSNSLVSDNVCLDNGRGSGIIVYGDDDGGYVNGLVVDGNRCGNSDSGGSQQYGLRIEGLGHTNVRVIDNDFRNNAVAAVSDAAGDRGVQYGGNQGVP